jgi:CRP-like cAMP-binding protein
MSIEDDINFFENVPTLRLLGRSALRVLAIGAESRYVHGGEILFRKGDAADSGYVIQEGAFKLTVASPREDAEGKIIIRAGQLLSELGLITRTIHALTASAVEPSTVIRIPRTLFMKMLEGHPDAARRLRDHYAARVDESSQDLLSLREAFKKAGAR